MAVPVSAVVPEGGGDGVWLGVLLPVLPADGVVVKEAVRLGDPVRVRVLVLEVVMADDAVPVGVRVVLKEMEGVGDWVPVALVVFVTAAVGVPVPDCVELCVAVREAV